ncbi:MAG: site-2 protease family protein [Actinomycetota bacterium]|nr:site-2 protease family protein [Actinomycetota bacterium]
MLSFSLLRIPVKINWSFLLMAALLGFVGRQDPAFVLAWVAIVFVSILVHELGHALTARGMGAAVAIELNGLGGLTRWSVPPEAFGPGRRAVVAAAGSAVGLAFGGLIWIVASQFGPYSGLTFFVINNLIFVNVFWGLLNWIPIRPLDGGHLLLSLLEKVAPVRAGSIARVIFSITAGIALAWALRAGFLFIAILAGWMLLAEFSSGGPRQPAAGIPELSYDDDVEEGPIDVEGEELGH